MPRIKTIEIAPVPVTEREALYELVDQYLAELMKHRDVAVGPANALGYKYLPLYWEEAGRHPFYVTSRGARVGFALVREVPKTGIIQMSDFFILQHARRSGIGQLAVAELWRRFPGSWELQVHPLNEAAVSFWCKCIERLSTGLVRTQKVQEEDGCRVQYNFEIA